MVVFTCNACSAVLKRNQVDKHCNRCRGCESLACVDCGKDFWGDDYQQHTKCMTEEEKYHGKDKAPKVFKGEAKQEQWVEQVQGAIDRASSKPKLKGILERLREYPNIPRKKAKFENFIKNCVRVNNPALISEVWEELMTGKKMTEAAAAQESAKKTESTTTVSNSNGQNGSDTSENLMEGEPTQPNAAKNKREKKEERRKNAHKKEKKDKTAEGSEDTKEPKKNKKRKRLDTNEEEDYEEEKSQPVCDAGTKKKKQKKREAIEVLKDVDENVNGDSNKEEDGTDEEEPPAKRKKTKFNWKKVIMEVLEKKGEMSLKKLKKKVLSEFAAQDAANYCEENLSRMFDRKIIKTEGVKVFKDKAKLKNVD